jgi:hypothetical protein
MGTVMLVQDYLHGLLTNLQFVVALASLTALLYTILLLFAGLQLCLESLVVCRDLHPNLSTTIISSHTHNCQCAYT